MFLAIRDIRFAKGRFALMGTVVALISLLLVLLSGLTAGLGNQSTSAIEQLGGGKAGDKVSQVVFGAPAGNDAKASYTESQVTQEQLDSWAGRSGVQSAVPLGISQSRFQGAGDSKGIANVAVFGVGKAIPGNSGPGGPETADGIAPSDVSDTTVVIGEGIAKELTLASGDAVTIAGTEFTVAGIVPDQWYSHSSVVWTTLGGWTKIAHLSDPSQLATVLAVTFQPGANVDTDTANAAAGTVSATRSGSFQGLGGYKSENGSLLMMQAFLYGISALVIVAFLTVWTVQRTRDIAVLKAMGASGGYLLRDALTQAALVLIAGAGLGGLVGVAGGLLAGQAAPFLLTPATTLAPVIGIVVLGLAGAAIAVRKVTRVDAMIALGGN
ncbi:ABC transporter substrate-binding protein [Arthrobacter alpinus]|uniref:ABC transporter permease n=1 Tax=Arthrobacter alpinus TaxID=656366 RepID=UPI0005CB6132|nr:ABC transporter permease [Arthrobacter alpinus]ALV46770.1 ABC transporter substrate-binding protein [Arthrobacter alpinus]